MSTGDKETLTHAAGDCPKRKALLEQLSGTEQQLQILLYSLQGNLDSGLSASVSVLFEKLRSEFLTVQKENDSLKKKLKIRDEDIADLEDDLDSLKKALESEREDRNNLQQNVMKETLRFVGVESDDDEDCAEKVVAIIRNDLQLAYIRKFHISLAQRVGARGKESRPIVVKFIARRIKTQVIMRRRMLKGTGIVIVEDLTSLNTSRLNQIRAHPNVKGCWSKDGRLIALLKSDKRVVVKNGDLSVLEDKEASNNDKSSGSSSDSSSEDSDISDSKDVSPCKKKAGQKHPDKSPLFSQVAWIGQGSLSDGSHLFTNSTWRGNYRPYNTRSNYRGTNRPFRGSRSHAPFVRGSRPCRPPHGNRWRPFFRWNRPENRRQYDDHGRQRSRDRNRSRASRSRERDSSSSSASSRKNHH